MADRSFVPKVRRIPIARGGRIDSKDLQEFTASSVDDIHELAAFLTTLSGRVEELALVDKLERMDLRGRVDGVEREWGAHRENLALGGFLSTYAMSVADSRNVDFLSASSYARRVMVDTLFGEATVPINGIEHRFYSENVRSKALLPIPDLQIDVTGTFDAGAGVTNHESGATVTAGQPSYAFNGNNNKRWMRRLEYPLSEDRNEVMTELTVTIPSQAFGQANVVYIVPFPEGEMDIMNVSTSPDLSTSFTQIPGFSQVDGAKATRWIFPAQAAQRLKIRFRQRNWVEENGKRVFYIGAQEIGMQLVDFDKTWDSGGTLTDNNTFIMKATAPDGFNFEKLTMIRTDPMFDLELSGQRHLHIKVDTAGDGTNVVWDSDTDSLPQNVTGGFNLGATPGTLYFIVTMNWVASTGGPSSPFSVGTTPYLRGIQFQAQTVAA